MRRSDATMSVERARWLRRRREVLSFVSSYRYNVGELPIGSSIRAGVDMYAQPMNAFWK